MRKNPLTPTKDQFFEGVSNGDREVIQQIYEKYFGKIESFVKKNNGSLEEAKDVFQDALMTVYVKSKNEDLKQLDCSFYTFLYAVCRNLWLKKLRKKKIELRTNTMESNLDLTVEIEESIAKRERWQFYKEKFNLLKEPCQKILKLFFEKYNFSEISEKLGLGSANYAKKKKYFCKKQLMELMMKDKRFKELNGQ
ncbi:MAG: sigma-70 family RNA polymerase sigma factor [Bacteroidota bacterium]